MGSSTCGGDNFHDVPTCISALAQSPTKSGVLTEMTMTTSTWSTVLANPGFSGEFVWTGVDYLGEAVTSTGDPVGSYPTIGNAGNALMDELGTPNPNGYAWQPVWGVPKTTPPATGTTAAKVVVAADHPTVLGDANDVSVVTATIADAAGPVVSGATTPGTFALDLGPGTIVAVDKGSMTAATFRGDTRAAYRGTRVRDRPGDGSGDPSSVTAQSGHPDERLRDSDCVRRHLRAVRELRDLQLKHRMPRRRGPFTADAWPRIRGSPASGRCSCRGGSRRRTAPRRVILRGRIELEHIRHGAECRRRARARSRPNIASA